MSVMIGNDHDLIQKVMHFLAERVSPNEMTTADMLRVEALARRGAETMWRPIEEAPKDGTQILTNCKFEDHISPMTWIEGDGYALWIWVDEFCSDADPSPEQPTHFIPLAALGTPEKAE